jgi:RNA polymerase sigma-70 factor (ECF subfamily)
MVDYSEWNDEKLLKEYRQGNDPRIVEILFTRHADVGFRVAMRFMHNEADAEDILQGAFIQFLRDLHQFREGVSVKPWLMKMIVNNCKDKYKEEKRRIKREQKVVSERFLQKTPESLEVKYEDNNSELQKKLRQSVDELPEKYRSPIWLILYEEFSYREVASVLALPEKTIRTQVARGLEKLREKLSSMGSVLSVTMIIEKINSSPLEIAPAYIKEIVKVDKLNALAKDQVLNQAKNIGSIKVSSFAWFLLTSVIITFSIGGFYYWEQGFSVPEINIFNGNKINLAIENKNTYIHINFNKNKDIDEFAFKGEYKYLESGGIDNSGCIEIPYAFSLRIPVKSMKLPLKITCRSNIKFDQPGMRGFVWVFWDGWEKIGQFYDINPSKNITSRLGEYIAKNSIDWTTETYWITKDWIDAWVDNRRCNLYIVNQEAQNEYLYLVFYNCTKKIDELIIESATEEQVPSISEYQKIYEDFLKNNESTEYVVKKLKQASGSNIVNPKFNFYGKQNKENVIEQLVYKLKKEK